MVQYNETSFPSLGGASSNDDWAASDDTQPQPPAKLGPVNLSSAPPAPTKPAHPPPAPYRDSKRAPPPASQPSPSGYYPSGNARMAPAQVPPVKAPPAPVLRVPLVPRSAGPAPSTAAALRETQYDDKWTRSAPQQFHPSQVLRRHNDCVSRES